MNLLHFSEEPQRQPATVLDSQLEDHLLALQSGAPVSGEPQVRAMPGPGATVRRVLLLAQGECALTVAQAAAKATRSVLPAPQPFAWVQVDGDVVGAQQFDDAVQAAAAQLASRSTAADLLRQGYQVDRRADLHVWLLASPDPGETSASTAAAAAAVLRAVEGQIWRTLRLRTQPHVALLAHPQAGASVAQWVAALREAGISDVSLCGDVNLEHQSLSAEEWTEHVADALIGLCWGILPSHAVRDLPGTISILGASVWPSSLPHVRRWLGLSTALNAVQTLLQEPISSDGEDAQTKAAAAAGGEIDVLQWDGELGTSVPEPAALQYWGARQPSWSHLPELAGILAAEAQAQDKRRALSERPARMAWLAETLDRYLGQLEAEKSLFLTPEDGLPGVRLWQADLERRTARLNAAMQVVDDALEQASQAVDDAQKAEKGALAAVREVAEVFPPQSASSAFWLLVQFWRWPMLIWAYLQMLPNRGQALYAAQSLRRLAVWREANWHVIRQLLFGLQLHTRQAVQEHAALVAALEQLASRLGGQRAALEAEAQLAPWTPESLQDLWRATESELVAGRLAAYLALRPVGEWAAGAADAQWAALLTAMSGAEPVLADWTSLECLVNGLERVEVTQRDPLEHLLKNRPLRQPFAWLDEQFMRATPLWPKPSMNPDIAQQNWLLLPADCASPGRSTSRQAANKVQWWVDTFTETVGVGVCAGDALVFLRWVSMAIKDLENEE